MSAILEVTSAASDASQISPAVLRSAEEFVRRKVASHDSSHDWLHIERVVNLAQRLAADEGLSAEQQAVIKLAALLHDVDDYKYSGDEGATAATVMAFLEEQQLCEAVITQVQGMIATIGFKEELQSQASTSGRAAPAALSIEAAVLQDADRLDAIGAVGIARALTFGGFFKRTMHNPSIPPRGGPGSAALTKAQYTDRSSGVDNTTINHFYEKLLLLKDKMKTKSGKAVAASRHAYMEQFLQQFYDEWAGRA